MSDADEIDKEIREAEEEISKLKEDDARELAEARADERALTMLEEFETFLRDDRRCARMRLEEGEPEKLRELEAQRYLYLMAAQVDVSERRMPVQLVHRLEQATNASDLSWCQRANEVTQVRHYAKYIEAHRGNALVAIAATDDELSRQRELFERQRAVLNLEPDDIVDGQYIKPEALKRLIEASERPLNVGVEVDPDDNDYMKSLRSDARQAHAFIEGGLQLPELDNGVTADSSTAVKQTYNDSLTAAAIAIQRYEHEHYNVITRSDGNPNMLVCVNLESYYAQLKEQNVTIQDIRLQNWMHPLALPCSMRMVMQIQQERFDTAMMFRNVLDCAVFVPRLALLFAGQPMPRVVEFSRIYRLYTAAVVFVKQNIKAPTTVEKGKEQRRLEKKLRKAQDEETKDSVAINPSIDKLPFYADTNPSEEAICGRFDAMRKSAFEDWFRRVRELRALYHNEVLFHTNVVAAQLLDYKPRFLPKQVERDPHCISRAYYMALWEIIQHACIDQLWAFEALLLLRLQKFISPDDREWWMTRRLVPTKEHNNPLTEGLLLDANKSLCALREQLVAELKSRKDYEKVPSSDLDYCDCEEPLGDVDAIDNDRVQELQTWSPTFAQMKLYHRHIPELFLMSEDQQAFLFDSARVARATKK